MRIAWFTPFNRRSAVGEFAHQVTVELAEHADVEIWAPDIGEVRSTDLPLRRFALEPELLRRLRDVDHIVYNIGDHLPYHAAIYDASRGYPGIVILNDRTYQHFFAAYWIERNRGARYIERMEAFYGTAGRRAAEDSLAGLREPVWERDDDAMRFPLFEDVLVGARGAIVHTESHAELVRRRWLGPVGQFTYPAYPPPRGDREKAYAWEHDSSRLLAVTVGHVNRNKQTHKVVEALIRNRGLGERVRYVIVGPYDLTGAYASSLLQTIERERLQGTVDVLGFRPDEEVAALMDAADLFVNLRYPAMEGWSASLGQQLALGKPTLVTDTGNVAELPDDVVVKVAPENDAALERALSSLVEDETLRHKIGTAAAEFASDRSPKRYAREFIEFVDEVRSWAPILELCDTVTVELAAIGTDASLRVVDVVAEELAVLADGGSPEEEVELRELAADDAEPLSRFFVRNNIPEVLQHFHPFRLTADRARHIALHTGRDRYYGAFVGGEVVGMSMLRGWDEGYEVPSFGVVVDHRHHGRGIGSLLTDYAIDQARALGCERVRLSVYASNRVAHRMYEARGFIVQKRSEVRLADGSDERIVMVKELTT
jgi:glycosyltransferase involved in cell wall biosynthesis/ribosomal protein S18 acetylase RimI-like enzyme